MTKNEDKTHTTDVSLASKTRLSAIIFVMTQDDDGSRDMHRHIQTTIK